METADTVIVLVIVIVCSYADDLSSLNPNPHVQARVMFWGCASYYGVETLVPVELEGNVNLHKCVNDECS